MMTEEVHKGLTGAVPEKRLCAPADMVGKVSSAFYRYGPCRRNHALGSGGNLLDGCQEFDADSDSSKTCSACGCHRSFHVKIVDESKMEAQHMVLGTPQSGVGAFTPLVSPAGAFFAALSPDSSRENAGNERAPGAAAPIVLKGRKPCRSKQLRAKACQIWSEYLRPWAAAEGINFRFCESKEICVSEMQKGGHALCISKCNQLKWPANVPFAHPKDMASKELQAFINSYERDWQEYCLRNHGMASTASCALVPRLRKDLDPCKVSTKELRYWLRENGKAVFCVHPKAANQFVNMGKLATMILRSGGKCKFEAANGWDTFVSSHEGMNKPALSAAERRKCIRTVKRLYNKFMMEFIQDTLREMGLENDGEMAMAEVSDDGANEDEEESGDGDVSKAISGSAKQGLYLRDNDLNGTPAPPQRCLGPLGLM